MQKMINLAKDYANRFQECFTIESTDSWISRFGGCRFDHSIQPHELNEDEFTNTNREIFINEFLLETKKIIESKNITTDKNTNKKQKLVKRKKD